MRLFCEKLNYLPRWNYSHLTSLHNLQLQRYAFQRIAVTSSMNTIKFLFLDQPYMPMPSLCLHHIRNMIRYILDHVELLRSFAICFHSQGSEIDLCCPWIGVHNIGGFQRRGYSVFPVLRGCCCFSFLSSSLRWNWRWQSTNKETQIFMAVTKKTWIILTDSWKSTSLIYWLV